jgi:DivIVA domain-containing protein
VLIVFAVAALAVLVVVAYLATGRGGGLGPLPDEEIGFELPRRPLTPADLQKLRLGRTIRGYRVDQVDQLIKRMASELTTRDARISELERKLRLDAIAASARPLVPRRAESTSTVGGGDATESTGGESSSDSVDQSPPRAGPPQHAARPKPGAAAGPAAVADPAEPTRGE